MVFQSYAIWPHMTVFDNVAYGLRVRKLPQAEVRHERRARAGPGADARFRRRPARSCPADSSSAWRWRARSRSPRACCCSTSRCRNLDAKLRAEMRVELRELQRRLDITSLYVTHDQEEALAISDRVIVMNGGRIEQIGSPEDIYNRPRSRFVADFVGSANLIKGKVRGPSGKNQDADVRCRRRHAPGGLSPAGRRSRQRTGDGAAPRK